MLVHALEKRILLDPIFTVSLFWQARKKWVSKAQANSGLSNDSRDCAEGKCCTCFVLTHDLTAAFFFREELLLGTVYADILQRTARHERFAARFASYLHQLPCTQPRNPAEPAGRQWNVIRKLLTGLPQAYPMITKSLVVLLSTSCL